MNATIAGKPVEEWERTMHEIEVWYHDQGWGDIAGIVVTDLDEFGAGRCMVTEGRIPNDFRGIRSDGTRIESGQLLREGRYGPWPGKCREPEEALP